MFRRMRWRWGARGKQSRKGGARRGVTRSREGRSGGFRARQFGQHLVQADARGKAGTHYLGLGDIEEAADGRGRVAFDVAEQEEQALVGGQVAYGNFKVWTADIAMAESSAGNDHSGRFLIAQGKALVQRLEERGIDGKGVGVLLLLKGTHESNGENFFRLDLIS